MHKHALLISILVVGCGVQNDGPSVATTHPRSQRPANDIAQEHSSVSDNGDEDLELLAFPPVIDDSEMDTEIEIPEITIEPPFDIVPVADRDKEILNVFEAVFRHLFANNVSHEQQNAASYHLSIKRKDPSDQFLERFRGHEPPVRKGSEFRMHERRLKFHINSWNWLDNSSVELTGGYYEGGVSASGNRYIVVKRHGKWIVEKDVMEWIS